ncbi:MAG: hypothetical protein IJL87_03020, partial [Clostridia bacterium]|nr:hypothetical protein [Clostridia bacterium]
CNSSLIFALRFSSSGLLFLLLLIFNTSKVMLLFYTTLEVYTILGMVSSSHAGMIQNVLDAQIVLQKLIKVEKVLALIVAPPFTLR